MVPLFVGSVTEFAGKTMVALGLADRFRHDGYKIAYFKHLGRDPILVNGKNVDEDALLFRDFLKLEQPLDDICPVVLSHDLRIKILREDKFREDDQGIPEKIFSAFNRASQGKDIVIVGGAGNFFEGSYIGISAWQFIHEINCNVVIVDHYETDYSIDNLLATKHNLPEGKLVGVVFNKVNENKLDYLKRLIVPFLERRGIDVLGIIPRDNILGSIKVRELVEVLGGEVLCCADKLDRFIEHFDVGAMNVEGALRHFRKSRNKAVITGGDRADIQLAALETNTTAVVLTGGLYPNDIIIGNAESHGVPLILVRTDTLTAIETLSEAMGRMRLTDGKKAQRSIELVGKEVDFTRIYRRLKPDLDKNPKY